MAYADWQDRERVRERRFGYDRDAETQTRAYTVPRESYASSRPDPGTLMHGESDTLTAWRVLSMGAPKDASNGEYRVTVTYYKITGTATRLTGATDDLIELERSDDARAETTQRTYTVRWACLTDATPNLPSLGDDGPTGYTDYLHVARDRQPKQWPGHDLIVATYLDRRPQVADDGVTVYETLTEVVADGGTLPVPGDLYSGDTALTGRYVYRVEYARPITSGKTLCGVTYYTIRGSVDDEESPSYITLPQSPVSLEDTDQRVFDVTLACLPATASPTWGQAYADDTVTDIHQATLLNLQRQPQQWPGHDAIRARYVGTRQRSGVTGELKSSYVRERIGLRNWRSRRVLEIAEANLKTTEDTLYDAVDPYLTLTGDDEDYTPRCVRTRATSESRPGVMELVAWYETPRNENYARVSVRGSKRTEPLVRDLDDKVLDGPIETAGQRGFWRIVSGYTSKPKGVAVIMVHTASRDVVDLSDLVSDKMWRVNDATMSSLGSDFTPGTMLLLGPEMTRYWRKGALWYIDYAFLYEPEGHNELTKRQAFCEYLVREPELVAVAGSFEQYSTDQTEWTPVMRESAGYLTADGDGNVTPTASSPESTRIFEEADFSELNGKITWDE